jgi:hypothetical protein
MGLLARRAQTKKGLKISQLNIVNEESSDQDIGITRRVPFKDGFMLSSLQITEVDEKPCPGV